eukprot:gene8431-5909_t
MEEEDVFAKKPKSSLNVAELEMQYSIETNYERKHRPVLRRPMQEDIRARQASCCGTAPQTAESAPVPAMNAERAAVGETFLLSCQPGNTVPHGNACVVGRAASLSGVSLPLSPCTTSVSFMTSRPLSNPSPSAVEQSSSPMALSGASPPLDGLGVANPESNRPVSAVASAHQYEMKIDALMRENSTLRRENDDLRRRGLDQSAVGDVEKIKRALTSSLEYSALQRLQYGSLLEWMRRVEEEPAGFPLDPRVAMPAPPSESCVREEIMKLSQKLGLDLADFASMPLCSTKPFPVLQNSGKCWLGQLTADISVAVHRFAHCLESRRRAEKEALALLMQAYETWSLQKMKRVASSLTYLESKHQMLKDRLLRLLKEANLQKIFTNKAIHESCDRTAQLEEALQKARSTAELLRTENSELRKALSAVRQRCIHSTIKVPLERSEKLILQGVEEAVRRLERREPGPTADESFVKTMRLTAMRAEAQVQLLAPVLESLAPLLRERSVRSRPLNEEPVPMSAHQREYYGRMKSIIRAGKENEEKDAVCKTLFSASPQWSASDSTTAAPVPPTDAFHFVSHEMKQVAENFRLYAQHLGNIAVLIENDTIQQKEITRDFIFGLRRCETLIVTEFKGLKSQVTRALESSI